MTFICHNGNYLPFDSPVLTASNRSFKWGDGVFETIRVQKGTIQLKSLHFERLFFSLEILQVKAERLGHHLLEKNILELCSKNNCIESARVRVAVFRDEENAASYLMEAIPLTPSEIIWQEKGLAIDIYPFARKSMDAISNLKSANFLPYVLADRHAKENGLDDAIVLNAASRICDTSRANIFMIRRNVIFTPALSEGCINGVMRRFVLDQLKHHEYTVHQASLTEDDLFEADELFLTNAIMGIRWVQTFRKKTYSSRQVFSVFNEIFTTIPR